MEKIRSNVISVSNACKSEYINKQINLLSEPLLNHLVELFQEYPSLWMARVSELSFSDPVWKAFVKARSIQEWLKRHSTEKVVIERTDVLLASALQTLCPEQVISQPKNYRSVLEEVLKPWVRRLRYQTYWLSNVFNEVVTAIVMGQLGNLRRSLPKNKLPETAVYCNYPSNWEGKDNQRYRFTGSLLDNAQFCRDLQYVVSPIHSNQTRIRGFFPAWKASKRLVERENITILQFYSKLTDVFAAYRFRKEQYAGKNLEEALDQFGLSFAMGRLHLERTWIDMPKQRSLYLAMGRYLDANPNIKRLLVPIFELVEGRAVVKAARERGVEVIGLQHGAAGKWGSWRVVLTTAALHRVGSLAVPNRVAVEGILYAEAFRKVGFGAVDVVGASRIRSLPPSPPKLKSGEIPVLLVLLDLHYWRPLADWSVKLACEYSAQVIIRAHPKQQQQVTAHCDQQFRVNVNLAIDQLSTLNQAIEQYRPHAVIAGSTGGVLELALNNWPCFLFVPEDEPLWSPLAWQCSQVELVTPQPDSISAMFNLLSSGQLESYCESLRQCAKRHISTYGTQADQNLAKLMGLYLDPVA
jgi:hypothetical protein